MNRAQIRARVQDELQWAPEIREATLDIDAVINAQNQAIGAESDRPWLRATAPVWVMPDLVLENSVVQVANTSTYGERHLSIVDTAFSTLYATVGDWVTRVRPSVMPGAEFGVTSKTDNYGTAANWDEGPFTIELAISHPTASPSETLIFLDPRASIPAMLGTEGTFTLSFPRICLPADCDNLLRILDENGYPLSALNSREERAYITPNLVAGSRPHWVLEDRGHAPEHVRLVYPGLSDNNPGTPDQTDDHRQLRNVPINIAPTLELTLNGFYPDESLRIRAFFSWFYAGRFGPPGPEAELVLASTGAADRACKVSVPNNFLLPQGSGSYGFYGRRLAVFVSENDSAFYHRGWIDPGATDAAEKFIEVPGYRDQFSSSNPSASPLKNNGALVHPRFFDVYPNGPYGYVRVAPRATTPTRYELDYIRKPRPLEEDGDEPEFPDTYHELLVWRVCEHLANRYSRDGSVGSWEAKRREWEMRLEQHYSPERRYAMVKGGESRSDRTGWLSARRITWLG